MFCYVAQEILLICIAVCIVFIQSMFALYSAMYSFCEARRNYSDKFSENGTVNGDSVEERTQMLLVRNGFVMKRVDNIDI